MIDYNTLKMPVNYDSPLTINYVERMANDLAKCVDDGVMRAVVNAGFDIDKDKLVQVLQQDKERYSDAYRKGCAEGYKKRDDEIIRCRDCKFYWGNGWCNRSGIHLEVNDNWYCADAERKEEDE